MAARAAQAHGARRVLIVDWDVHHGNGTEAIFEADPTVLFFSVHAHFRGRFYPGTGAPGDVGVGGGRGYSVNVGWDCTQNTDADYVYVFEKVLLPVAREFEPDLVLVSCGFDAGLGVPGRVQALGGKGPQRRLGRRLQEVAKAVVGGYCWLQMPLRLALAVRETVAGRRLGALEGGGYAPPPPNSTHTGGTLPPFQCISGGGVGGHKEGRALIVAFSGLSPPTPVGIAARFPVCLT